LTQDTIFLKLGGSLITDKSIPGTAHTTLINQISAQLAKALQSNQDLRILLGHGSGSFGHIPAKKYDTRNGVHSPEDWRGFATVWQHASELNTIVMNSLHEAGIPAVSFAPSSTCTTYNGKIEKWDTAPLKAALKNGILPVVFGDVAFDRGQGGTIVSTEDVFAFLAKDLNPSKILIAGMEEGVWADYPACTRLVRSITPESFKKTAAAIKGSENTDVTGGMDSKVREMLNLLAAYPYLKIRIFSGKTPDAIFDSIGGKESGTLIHS
jgi:isopentenyl phosphate kinase